MELEKEFEIRKSIHMINVVQLYLSHKYFEDAQQEAVVPPQILQMAIAEQVVNDIDGIVLSGKLPEEYTKADKYLINHHLDIDDFVTKP